MVDKVELSVATTGRGPAVEVTGTGVAGGPVVLELV